MKVLDLFCGAGGLALGFKNAGFEVTGVDISKYTKDIFTLNKTGEVITTDLSTKLIRTKYDIIVGGPPCKPWASVNVTRRGKKHKDYRLLSRFFRHIECQQPTIFLLENVPPLTSDKTFVMYMERLKKCGYSIMKQVIKFANFGAPTSRRRLIVFGIINGDAQIFFEKLPKHRKNAKTVRDVIWHLKDKDRGEVPDHIWPELKTIHKYRKYYETGKFGWYILKWNEPAPSFGNIMKTYILHPDGFNGIPPRVISVREALLIMGFDKNFQFPDGMGIGAKYQMTADAVSPIFSCSVANAIKEILNEVD